VNHQLLCYNDWIVRSGIFKERNGLDPNSKLFPILVAMLSIFGFDAIENLIVAILFLSVGLLIVNSM